MTPAQAIGVFLDRGLPPYRGRALEMVFHTAARNQDLQTMAACLALGLPVDFIDSAGQTPLDVAAAGDAVHSIDLLLREGADPARAGAALIDTALENRGRRAAELLLRAGAPIDAVGRKGWTALSRAVKEGRQDIIDWLLERGADPLASSSGGTSALTFAVNKNDAALCARLLDACAPEALSSPQGAELLNRATRQGFEDLALLLLDRGAPLDGVSAGGWSTARAARARGLSRLSERLEAAGAGPLPPEHDALVAAAEAGDVQAVQRELAAGSPPDYRTFSGWTALEKAAAGGHVDVATALLDAGAQLNGVGVPPLVLAAKGGFLPVVELLLARGADPNARSATGSSAFACAESKGHHAVQERLRRAGASVDLGDGSGTTPLMSATLKGDLARMDALLAAGADPNAVDVKGDNAFSVAYKVEVVERLLAAGGRPEQKNHAGGSALLGKLASRSTEAVVFEGLTHARWRAADQGDGDAARCARLVPFTTDEVLALWATLGDVAVMRGLRAAGLDVPLGPALEAAVRAGQAPVIALLAEWGADLQVEGPNGSPLLVAAACAKPAAIKALLVAGALPSQDPTRSPLAAALRRGDDETIRALLRGVWAG